MYKRQVLTTTYLLPAATDARAAIGAVTEMTGPTEIQRDKTVIPGAVNTGIESLDTVVTARAKAEITFDDDTKVQITVSQSGPAGSNGFTADVQVTGSSNTIGVTQSGTVDSNVSVHSTGSNNNISCLLYTSDAADE